MKGRFRVGQRVRLVSCQDPYTRIKPGTLGTVTFHLLEGGELRG